MVRVALSIVTLAAGALGPLILSPLPAEAAVVADDWRLLAPHASLTPNQYAGKADAAFASFIRTYWDPGTRTFFSQSDHRPRVGGKATAPFWWTAEAWETVLDDFERTGSTSSRSLIDAVFDGFVAVHPTLNSNYNDDRGWLALGATRAYKLTGESRYLVVAEQIADQQWRYWDGTFGGGIWWRESVRDQKNVATNAPAAMINARLYGITGREKYLRRAIALFGWVDASLRSGGRLDDRIELPSRRIVVDYTYNYGTYIGAALDLYRVTRSRWYLDRATSMADSALRRLVSGTVLRDEGTGDGGGFKGIFVRNLRALATAGAVPLNTRAVYASFLARNADVAWKHRNASVLWGSNWAAYPPSGPVEILTDMSAVNVFGATAFTR